MSYPPKTMLSYADGNGSATVLTDGNVMVRSGLGAGQMMKLDDWIILAHGALIVEDYVPLESDYVQQEEAEPEPLKIGTKLRWTFDQENYRVAIKTDKGVLQVKSVTNGAGDCHEDGCRCTPCCELRMVPPPPWRSRRPLKATLFESESAWKFSLPSGGTIEISPPDNRTPNHIPASLSDVEKVQAIHKLYKITTHAVVGSSPYERAESLYASIVSNRRALNELTLEHDLTNPWARRTFTDQLKYGVILYHRAKAEVDSLGQMCYMKPTRVFARCKNNLFAEINGNRYVVATFNDKLTLSKPSRHTEDAKLYDDFAQMGNPKFYVVYRRKQIPLNW